MHYFLLIYFSSKSLHVSSSLAVHHQQVKFRMYSNWYVMRYADWLLTGSGSIPYTNCCLYRVAPPDDEQQACS
jgi:hypothetical protein